MPGKAAQVFAFTIDARDPGFVLFGAVVKKGEPIEPVAQTLIETVEGAFAKTPATEEELKRQVQQQRTAFDRALADPQAFGVGLSEYIALGDWRLFFLTRDQFGQMKTAQIDQAAQRYFVRDNRTVGYYLPDDSPRRAEIPAAPTPAQRLADYKPTATSVGRGSLRSVAGEHQQAHAAPGVRRPQGRAAAQAEPRRHRARADQFPLGRREDAQRPRDRR